MYAVHILTNAFIFYFSATYNMPMADCAMIKDFVKHDLRVRLVRKLTTENAGVHKPFVKEMYDQRIYYGESVEVFCRCYVYFTFLP